MRDVGGNGKWMGQRFWVGVVRAMLIDDPNLRVRRVKTPEEAIGMSDPSVSMLDLGDINSYEWVT